MAKCELTVVREQGDLTYRGGEPIRGQVLVRVDATCRCDGLTLRPEWRTHGRGNVATGEEAAVELFRGEWTAGDEHAYPFEVAAPSWPWTFHGHEVNLDWALVARADIPWALDPKGEAEIVVVPGRDTMDAEVALDREKVAQARALAGGCMVLFGLAFALPGLATIVGGLIAVASGELGGLVAVPFGGIFALVGVGVAFMGMRNHLARMRLGAIEASVAPGRARPGDVVTCTVRLSPRADVELNGVRVTLHGREVAVRGSGTNQRTYTHDLHREEVTLEGSRTSVRRLDDVELQHAFRLPADAPYSLSVRSNAVRWTVSFHVDVAGWPDWTEEQPLIVLP